MALIYANDYLGVLNILNQARKKFSLNNQSIADIQYGNVIKASHHNTLSGLISSSKTDIQNKGFKVTGTFSTPTVTSGQAIKQSVFNDLNTSANTLLSTCVNYSSDYSSNYSSDYGDYNEYGDYGNYVSDYSSNCGDLTATGYESNVSGCTPDCWINA